MTRSAFKKLSFFLVAIVLFSTLYLSTTYATLAPLTAPPLGGYDAGANSILDPGCGPTDTDCFVKTITADNGLTATGSNVQLGGTLLQTTLIDQNGNDFDITNGNFSFESDSDLLGFGAPGIGLTYNTVTEKSLIGMIDDPQGKFPAMYYLNNNYGGIGTSTERLISLGDVSVNLSNVTTFGGNTYQSVLDLGDGASELRAQNQTTNDSAYISVRSDNANPINNGIWISHQNISTTGNAYFMSLNSETGVTFDSNTGDSYTFPLADGTVNQVLSTNGAGQISWVDGGWSLTGNAGTTAGTNFIGTTDAQDFVIKVNGNEMGRFYENTGVSQYSIALGGGVAPSAGMFVFGLGAGAAATGADVSNFIGIFSGENAIGAGSSNFIGFQTGSGAVGAANSNFIGRQAGQDATNSTDSNFFGVNAGSYATDVGDSNFFGTAAGQSAVSASYSNFFGYNAGFEASFSGASNFIGDQAGFQASNSANSNFIGVHAGSYATGVGESNFIGSSAGYNSVGTLVSNFIGSQAGSGAYNVASSNFFGHQAGSVSLSGTTGASHSNFFGSLSGYNAVNASGSNFLGEESGQEATNAYSSNFFGKYAGAGATNAANSTFIGENAGRNNFNLGLGTSNAAHSIFIGSNAGYSALDGGLNNTTDPDDYSILIGNNTATGGFENSIALGANATNTASNEFMIGSTTRPITSMVLVGNYAGGSCTFAVGGMSCSSDERLKTNIVDLSNTALQTLQNVRTVTYNWNSDPNGSQQIGFIAQNLQQSFPQLVSTGQGGYLQVNYAGMTPVLVEAIKELDLSISDFSATNTNQAGLVNIIRGWLADAANGITKIFAGEVETKKLCVSDDSGNKTCITKNQLDILLNGSSVVVPVQQNPVLTPDPAITNPGVSPEPTPDPGTGDQVPQPDPVPTPDPGVVSPTE